MTILPTIERELRAQARQGLNHALRVLGPAALVLVGMVVASDSGFAPNEGGKIFGLLNVTLFLFIWLTVPMITADCISVERREGTIGLLFLTPLKARDIVVSKGLAHGLRALVLWLATLPMLTLPFLQGGLGWREAVLSAMINFSSICLALAAGVLVSCFCKRWLRAMVLTCLVAAVLVVALIWLTGLGIVTTLNRHTSALWPGMSLSNDALWRMGVSFVTGVNGNWGQIFTAFTKLGQPHLWIQTASAIVGASLLTLLLAVEVAAWRLRCVWQEEPPSARQKWLEKKLVTPVFGRGFLREWLHRKLERNPVGWLEMRSWTGRTVMWGWFGVMVIFYSVGLVDFSPETFDHLQDLMALLLLLGLAASAAGSFQRERETGVMELLLVSPMSEWRIIEGRLRGLWGQFLPSLALILAVSLYFMIGTSYGSWNDMMGYMCVGYLTIPVIGLYHSLRRKTFVSAYLLTVATGLLFPSGLGWILGYLVHGIGYNPSTGWIPGMDQSILAGLVHWLVAPAQVGWMQLAIAAIVCRRLYGDMRQRNFSFSRTTT